MTRNRGAGLVATAAMLLVALTACADEGNDPAAPGSTAPHAGPDHKFIDAAF